jgi:hypothetical protein
LGFSSVLLAPSPKLQDQEVGLPADLSVKATDWALKGVAGVKLKAAVVELDGVWVADVTGCRDALHPDNPIIVADTTIVHASL